MYLVLSQTCVSVLTQNFVVTVCARPLSPFDATKEKKLQLNEFICIKNNQIVNIL
jgi:hypothetical protein